MRLSFFASHTYTQLLVVFLLVISTFSVSRQFVPKTESVVFSTHGIQLFKQNALKHRRRTGGVDSLKKWRLSSGHEYLRLIDLLVLT